MVRFCFLIQLAILCLLTGELRPLTLSVNIEKCKISSHFIVFLMFTFPSSFFANLVG
jgi:hypothetical protein